MDLKKILNKDKLAEVRLGVQPAVEQSQIEDPDAELVDTTFGFLEEHEGMSPTVYKDTSQIDTIGVGANLNSPATQRAAKNLSINTGQLRASQSSLTPEQSQLLAKETLKIKLPEYKRKIKREPERPPLQTNQHAALLSLYYNNPQLIGPMLQHKVATGDDMGAAAEIMLRSNKDKLPGITKRRLAEAELYLGDKFPEIKQQLTPEDIKYIKDSLNSVENEHERARLLEKYGDLLS